MTGYQHVAHAPIVVGSLRVEPSARTVLVNGLVIACTAAEFGVVERLARHAGSAVTRDDLSHAVCGRAASPFDRAIDVHVSRLRAKLGPHGPRIVAVRGVGYLLAAPVEAEPSGSPTAGRSRVHHGS
jgi:two-component system response regulator CpxR